MNHRSKKILSYILSIIVIVGAGIFVASKFVHLGNVEFTDNAQVRQQIVPVISRVQGYVKEIRFEEYQPVHKGDTLVVLDDSDLRLRVAQARADLAIARAGKGVTDRNVTSASANDAVTRASIEEARVLMQNAASDYERYKALLAKDAVTRSQYDRVETDYLAKKARYETLVRQHDATGAVVTATRENINRDEAVIELAEATLRTAELNLSYAVITAPCDGYASRKEIQTGQLIQPGQTVLDVVDTGDTWVAANYKETQLKHIHIGSEVEITVDAIPGVTFKGKVEGISNATGASLSLLPQDNSAGNFVKVRQRIPVRIALSKDNPADETARLAAGMNVECKVRY